MIATCVIELSFLLYTIWRYRLNTLSRLACALLFFLAIFQLAEFNVCTGSGSAVFWSHAGYVAITALPALGIHALVAMRPKKVSTKTAHQLLLAAYGSAAAFVIYFALAHNSLNGHQCLGNYVIFQVNSHATVLYGFYYYGWVIGGMLLSSYYAARTPAQRLRQALGGFAFGYAVFLIPTTTANLLDKSTLRGIPSIMCGFAVLFAVILTTYVMPRAGKQRSRR